MIKYHVVIAVENRKPTTLPDGTLDTSRLAIPICTFTQTGTDAQGNPIGTTNPPQLHSMGNSVNIANPNIVYAASWDGMSQTVNVIKGAGTVLTMKYAGWPEN